MRDSIRLGSAALAAHAVRAGARDSARVGQRDMALRPAFGTAGSAAGRTHERPEHQPVREAETVHLGRSSVDRRGGSDHRTLGGHRVVVRGPRRF